MSWKAHIITGSLSIIVGLGCGIFIGGALYKENQEKYLNTKTSQVNHVDYFNYDNTPEGVWSYKSFINPVTEEVYSYAIKKTFFKDNNGKEYELSPVFRAYKNQNGGLSYYRYFYSKDLNFCQGEKNCTGLVKLNGDFVADMTLDVSDKGKAFFDFPYTEKNQFAPSYMDTVALSISEDRYPVTNWTGLDSNELNKAYHMAVQKLKENKDTKK